MCYFNSVMKTSLFLLALLPLFSVGVQAGLNYTCLPLPPRNTTASIFNLHPDDVKIVMGMGDSITAGFGILGSLNETRGHSFSVGGDAGYFTLPNLIKFFNPAVVGYSTGTYSSAVCYGLNCPSLQFFPDQDVNNAAKAGSMVFDMVSLQLNYLIREINQNPKMDVQNDWKVLTIHIGANDLCASCTFNLTYLSGDDYENTLMGTLERIRTSLPKTFVNLVAGYNISEAYELSTNTPRCNNVTRPFFIQCACLFDPANGAVREIIDAKITDFNARAANVAAYYQRKAYDNFAVVVQPFGIDTHVSDLPSEFISRIDCFHPSSRGQEALAVALWNNMLTPMASKKTHLDMSDTPICPTQDTLLYTF